IKNDSIFSFIVTTSTTEGHLLEDPKMLLMVTPLSMWPNWRFPLTKLSRRVGCSSPFYTSDLAKSSFSTKSRQAPI
ncbi:hypothetical protein PFISCL1PPCAC_25164, partial [Pristionchus fissidentatus]